VVLARDRLGIKPMYYSETPAGLAFASEARTLARLTGHVSINPEALIWYLQWGSVGSVSIFEGVNELPPGHFLIWERGSAHVKTWWSPQPSPIADLARDTTRLVRAALADSVARHLVADRPVGLFLSAGADSHAILRQAAAAADINALTITFPETGDDEGDQAAAHAGAVGARHQTVPITGEEIEQLLPTILGSMDQPTSDGVNTWMVCRAAKEAGMVVALSGIGGDELFGGYPSFRFVPRLAAAQRFLHFVPAGLRRSAAKWLSGIAPGGRASRVLIGAGGYSDAYRAVRGFFAEDGSYPFQTNSSLPQSSLNGDDPDPGNRVMRLELENYLPYQLLRDADSMSMSHSLELRVPLLDDVMVRVALALPPEIRNEKGKALLLRAAGIENSPPKRPFALPFDIWLRGPLRETVRAALLSDELPFADLIDSGFRRRVWEAFEAGRIPWSLPWSIAVLRLWPGANGFSW